MSRTTFLKAQNLCSYENNRHLQINKQLIKYLKVFNVKYGHTMANDSRKDKIMYVVYVTAGKW